MEVFGSHEMSGGAGRQMACVCRLPTGSATFRTSSASPDPTELRLCYQYLWLNGDKGFRLA